MGVARGPVNQIIRGVILFRGVVERGRTSLGFLIPSWQLRIYALQKRSPA